MTLEKQLAFWSAVKWFFSGVSITCLVLGVIGAIAK